MTEAKKELVVIGGGPGGYVAALKAAQLGAKVALVEKENLGGTCLNWGCIPTKVLTKTAELLHHIKQADSMGITVSAPELNLKAVQTRKEEVIETLKGGVGELLAARGVEYIEGEASLEKKGQVKITTAEGKTLIKETGKIIIATGSSPMELPGMECDGKLILDSRDALEIDTVPKSVLIVGGGVIGLEFAGIYAAFGAKVTLVEMLPDLLPFIDTDVVTALNQELSAMNITIHTSTKVSKLEKAKSKVKVYLETPEGDQQLEAAKVLIAAGRRANTEIGEKLGLVKDGVIAVNEQLETKIKGIYAIGDAIGGYQLAHAAYAEAHVAAENAMGAAKSVSYKAVPQAIFTYPEVSGVGLTEQEARKKHETVKIGLYPFAANGKAMAANETKGFVKLIATEPHDEIVGAFMIGPTATELIHEITLAINLEATLEEIAETIHAHPTLSEVTYEAALTGLS